MPPVFDPSGHHGLIDSGYDNYYHNGPEYLDGMAASRAVLTRFQSYPENQVQGSGTLVAPVDGPGKYFSLFQSPQVYQNPLSIAADILGGGTIAGTFGTQGLVDNSGGAY